LARHIIVYYADFFAYFFRAMPPFAMFTAPAIDTLRRASRGAIALFEDITSLPHADFML